MSQTARRLLDGGGGRRTDLDLLATALVGRMAPDGRIVDVLATEPNPFSSTFPTEIVTCELADGSTCKVFVKHGVKGSHTGHGYWGDAAYESRVHREVLAYVALGTPAHIAEWRQGGETVFAVEYIEGLRFSQVSRERMIDAVRWLARLHREAAEVASRCEGITRYDAGYYIGCATRAAEYVRMARPEADWTERTAARFERELVRLLVNAQQVFVHGEFYPKNVLVTDEQIRTVDWQSAALAPGEIDLASLTEGWPDTEQVRLWDAAYAAARWPDGSPSNFDAVMVAARAYWPMRWLGDHPIAAASPRRAPYVEMLRALADGPAVR